MRAKPAEQARSKEKRDLLLRVTEDLLGQKSFNQISVAEVAAAAGVSVATVYQRFNNKHAMGSILLELYFQRCRQWWAQGNEAASKKRKPTTLYDALVQLAEKSWEQINALGHIMRPAYLFSREHPNLVGSEWRQLEQQAEQGFVDFLTPFAEGLNIPNIKQSAASLCYFFNFMTLGKLLHSDEKQWRVLRNKKAFTKELADFAYGYLIHAGESRG